MSDPTRSASGKSGELERVRVFDAPANKSALPTARARIPKILHYVWVGGSPMPSRFRRNIRSWQKHNPEFELRLWNENNIDLTEPFVQLAREQHAWAKLSDYVRLIAIEQFGGIYLDTDVEAHRSFDELLDCQCFFGIQSYREEDDPICNAVFGAVPHHPFIRSVLEAFPRSTKEDLYNVGTGPELVSALLISQGLSSRPTTRVSVADVDVFPAAAFYPYHWLEELAPRHVTKDTFAIHHWDMSWHHAHASKTMKLLRLLAKSYPELSRPARRLYRKLKR